MNLNKLGIFGLFVISLIFYTSAWCNDHSYSEAIKELGERGGTKETILEVIGTPKHIKDIVVTDPETYLSGPAPLGCYNLSAGDRLTVWSYPIEKEGFYQLILKGNTMVCLRWKSGNDPFGGITIP